MAVLVKGYNLKNSKKKYLFPSVHFLVSFENFYKRFGLPRVKFFFSQMCPKYGLVSEKK